MKAQTAFLSPAETLVGSDAGNATIWFPGQPLEYRVMLRRKSFDSATGTVTGTCLPVEMDPNWTINLFSGIEISKSLQFSLPFSVK